PLEIDRLLDGFGGLLDTTDTVGLYFDDRSTSTSIASSTVKVVQVVPQRPEEYLSRRYESIAPDSTARPQKRSFDSNGHGSRSSLRDIIRPEDIELAGPSNGYVRTNKRQRVEVYERNREVDPDRPVLSRERDQVEIFSQRSWADRNRSPVRLVEDSQRSPIGNINQLNPYQTPTSLSMPSPVAAVESIQSEYIGVPDSPPSTSRSSFVDRSRPSGIIQEDDTKSESPELGQTLHAVPASKLSSPFDEREQIHISNAEDFLIRSEPPSATQANGHGSFNEVHQISTDTPTRLEPFTGPLLGKDLLERLRLKRPSPEMSLDHTTRPSGTVRRVTRDIYDPSNTSIENREQHLHTPKTKRPKTSAISSSDLAAQPDYDIQPHSGASPGVRSCGSGRRRSGIPESEVNWLQTQEKSICRPSENIYDSAIDQTEVELSASRDEERRANEVAEEKRREEEATAKVLQEKEQLRKVTEEQEAKRKEEQIEQERKVEAERIVREREQQAERERKAEEQRLLKQKEDEAAEAFKANEERVAREQEEKTKQMRLEKERKKEKARQARERKEQEKQEAERVENERKEERRLAKEKREKKKEQLRNAEQQRALKEAQDKAAKHAEAEAAEAVRRKAKEDEEKAKKAAKDAETKKTRMHGNTAKETNIIAEKDRKVNEAKQRARGSSETRSRHSSTPLITPDDKISGGNKGSTTPLIPSTSYGQSVTSEKPESLATPGTPAKGTGVDTQMPLPSALRQSPSTLRRSVSFVDEPIIRPIFKTPSAPIFTPVFPQPITILPPVFPQPITILPPGRTEKDLARVRSETPGYGQEIAKSKISKKSREPTKKKADGKVQSKLNIKRDIKLKGRLIDPPVQPKPPAKEEIIISSESEKSPSPYFSDPEDDPQQRDGAKAGPSSRSRCSSRSGSAKAKVTARMRSVSIPQPSRPEVPIIKPEPLKESMSDADSIQSYRSESEAGSQSKSASRSPARYVSRTPVSPSNSGSENAIKSSPPPVSKQLLEDKNVGGLTATSRNRVDGRGDNIGTKGLASLPVENGQILAQDFRATSAHSVNGTAGSQRDAHTKSVERDLENHLQRHISRKNVEPPLSRNGSSPLLPKRKEAQRKPTLPPKTAPSVAKTAYSPRPRTSRFPSLTGLKANPPKWDFKDGGAATMPDFMKPKPKQISSQKTDSLF
ncbi:MAG: hypothetical protein M1830_003107, partial [Pleopsidium flavum]